MTQASTLTLIGFNVQGCSTRGTLPALLREAKRCGVHVLLLQEHNFSADKTADAKTLAARCGYQSAWSSGTGDGSRGGTGVLVRDNLGGMAPVVDDAHGDTLEGRVCAADLVVNDATLRLVSVYVPVDSARRVPFLQGLAAAPWVCNNMIIQGDFNCVENAVIDTRRRDGEPDTVSQEKACTRLVRQLGLEDVYRLLNGQKASGFTRYSATVNKRIDRFYTPEFESNWRWLECDANDQFFRGREGASDHMAVRATLQVLEGEASRPKDTRIDPRVMSQEQVRNDVRRAIAFVDKKVSVADHGVARNWEATKQAIHEVLVAATKRQRRSGPRYVLEQELSILYKARRSMPPNEQMAQTIRDKEDELANIKKEQSVSPWMSYIYTLGEEQSSRIFYQNFKAKQASSVIPSVFATEDWDEVQDERPETEDDEGVANEFAHYSRWLFQSKPSRNSARMLQLLRQRQLTHRSCNRLEADISQDEVTTAIRNMAKGKSPGPDGLPSEVYQEFEVDLRDKLHLLLQDSLKAGSMPVAVRKGEIVFLYKKGEPREVRNYRPITLLNTDYKILAKILVARLKPVMDDIVSKPQLGFVPNRVITEATHLLKLVQAFLDETDGEGIIVAADWEKAFDRVSWTFLHDAAEALGFGPLARRWLHTLYNDDAPPIRTVRVNGVRSRSFPIHSGVPQGCPISPLIFLLVTEALTRAILDEPSSRLRGIQVGDSEVRITQFADDTQLLLAGYKYLRRVWNILLEYEEVSGMRANVNKFEGIRCGALKREPIPYLSVLRTEKIKWVHPGEYVRILGVPFWEKYDVNIFWEKKYWDVKRLMAKWERTGLTFVGRNMVLNAMFVGRFRYLAQAMSVPDWLTEAIDSDIQAFMWSKTPIDPAEMGSPRVKYRAVRFAAQHLPRKPSLGGGLVSWSDHLKALQCHWVLRYLDASRGDWKILLDRWLAREVEGRGAVATSIRIKDLFTSTTMHRSRIPHFWRRAVAAFRELGIQSMKPFHELSPAALKALPYWSNPVFEVKTTKYSHVWREHLHAHTIRDLIRPE